MTDHCPLSHSPPMTVDIYWRAENKEDGPNVLIQKDSPTAGLIAASSTIAELLSSVGHNMPLLLSGASKWDIKAVLAWVTKSSAEGTLPEIPMPQRAPIYRNRTLVKTAIDLNMIPLADIARERIETMLLDQADTTDVKMAYTHEPARFLRVAIVESIGEAWRTGRIRGKSGYITLCEEYPEFQKDMAAWWEKRGPLPK